MAFGIENSDEQLYWYRTPPMSVSPSSVRPYTFSQSFARGALWEEDTGDLPQQTAGTGNITCDLSSKISIGGVQNNQKYNFDVQSINTPFTFNNQNINNFTAIPPAVQDAIYNNTTQQNNNYYTTSASGGASGSVTSLSNPTPMWDNANMQLTFISKTTNFTNGLITGIVNNSNVVVTLTKLKDLSDWYATGSNTNLPLVSDVTITSNLNKEKTTLTLSNGLITGTGSPVTTAIVAITTCP